MRRLRAYIEALPRESAFRRAAEGDQAWWDKNTILLADIYDLINQSSRNQLIAAGVEGIGRPEPYPRPTTDEADEGVSLAQFTDMLRGGLLNG